MRSVMSEKELALHMAGGVFVGDGVQAMGAAWGKVSRLGYVCPLGGWGCAWSLRGEVF